MCGPPQGSTWTTANFSPCFPAQGYQGLTICVCNATSERERDLPHSDCPSCWKHQPCPDFFFCCLLYYTCPDSSSEVLGNTKRTQLRGLYLSRLCDRIYEIWNRNDSKQLCLCGSISVEPTASLFHYLTWHSPTAAPAPL